MNELKDREKPSVVVIDDDAAARNSLAQMLRLRGCAVEVFVGAHEALAWPGLASSDCVLTDVKMPGMDGEQFLARVKQEGLRVPVILITGHGDVSMAVRCLKSGAYDFVEKPFDDELLLASLSRAVEKARLQREGEDLRRKLRTILPGEDGRFGMIGRSRVMQDLYEQITAYAPSEAPVLIIGETGAGKELVARAIHEQSPRSGGPYVPVNASALPEHMLASELFGHAKGAFTGAHTERDGKFVTASRGTLLLDELETISLESQVQLLRVLEDSIVQPLGSDKPRKVDVRFLATTKADLKEQVRLKRMREDFYHRVVVLAIQVPPLRERREDIPLLVSHFVRQAAERGGAPAPEVSEETLEAMLRYGWPGNVRELKHAVERMVVTSRGGVAGSPTLEDQLAAGRLLSLPAMRGRLHDELEATEKNVIAAALREHGGEVTSTSNALGISRRALYERMKKYDLHKEDFRS